MANVIYMSAKLSLVHCREVMQTRNCYVIKNSRLHMKVVSIQGHSESIRQHCAANVHFVNVNGFL